MKTAVSIPDDVFEEAEAFARQVNRSRSQLYAEALSEYVARHAPDRVTQAMDRVLAEVDEPQDAFRKRSARRTLERAEW